MSTNSKNRTNSTNNTNNTNNTNSHHPIKHSGLEKVKLSVQQRLNQSKILISYVYNKKNEVIGTVVATDKDKIGWAKRNPKDKYLKYVGLHKAIQRADQGYPEPPFGDIQDAVARMRDRASRYYQLRV